MNILFVTPRFPYPPLKGDQVVAYHRLRLLGERHRITLLTLYQDERELEFLDRIKPFCEKIVAVKQNRFGSMLNLLGGVYSKLPFQVLYFRSRKFRDKFWQLVRGKDIDIVHFYMVRTAELGRNLNKPKVLDLIDLMQLNYQKRAFTERRLFRTAFKVESKRLSIYENDIVRKYDVSILVSENDKGAINSRKVVVVPLGVDTSIFKNDEELPNNKTIIFSGNMGYNPNENAINWFLENCFGDMKNNIPDLRLIISGNNPSSKIKALHDGVSIFVTGFVESMAETLPKAQLAIAPMQSGYGMHIKILEAMACGLPVVCTSSALGTIKAVDGKHVVVADDAVSFTNNCIRLSQNHELAQSIGRAARKQVITEYSWEHHVNVIENIYQAITLNQLKQEEG